MEPIQKLAGPLLIGYLLNLCLLGILFVQIFIYSSAFSTRKSRDHPGMKLLVYVLLLLELVQSAFILGDAYMTFAQGYGDVSRLGDVGFTWLTMPVLSGIVGCIVQMYYAFRIHILARKSYLLPLFIALMAMAQCAASIIVGVDEYNAKQLARLSSIGSISNVVWPVTSAFCDVTIAIATSFYIFRLNRLLHIFPDGQESKSYSSFRLTQTLLCRALHLTVETGTLTATFSVLYLLLWYTHPLDYYYMTFAFIMGKIYANSLMVIFNSRVSISDLRDKPRTLDCSDIPSLLCTMKSEVTPSTTQMSKLSISMAEP